MQISKPTFEQLNKGNRLQEIVGCTHTVYERVVCNDVSNEGKAMDLKDVKGCKIQKKLCSNHVIMKTTKRLDWRKHSRSS